MLEVAIVEIWKYPDGIEVIQSFNAIITTTMNGNGCCT
jgi:hypothetical protein